ncbi:MULTISPECIES: hypothetical protein [unclassified Mesorhizobium]|uniref:hypothetical protein n=1 Tax=unclassified Mesorhizobium TaxID=325217 RepID=UPI000FD49AD4|nr:MULTISPECIES: hypothetical protein [unclassified Mesorhizobium]RVD53773.1 hypothetical protein EN746_08325 [Mesorhizobium sp. M8A.F.Ca.ET.023.02.2.1]TGR47295.1 hypothetical protein EN842_23375 [bacterium M00.F.Ca.ET.199.01.1.1]TGU36749.1 hypothetical protein EN799_14160 [bacterium M00.F.Ca.ET.156.01.1.1]TGU89331.1 hypothetical protein EN794_046470 [Mesorhizobium sp. M00.F.Ca.ET.151.01.1.1]TGV87936.1 hypothetical protein EN792_010405 [Mesorhizobium sp. M00.F.Ca.ET.149.01.1.1]TGW07429.1 hypo
MPAENEVARLVDKQKLERADRESRIILDAERQARDAKTARLRKQRLSAEPSEEQQKPAPPKRRR